jgi:hypothetical protein
MLHIENKLDSRSIPEKSIVRLCIRMKDNYNTFSSCEIINDCGIPVRNSKLKDIIDSCQSDDNYVHFKIVDFNIRSDEIKDIIYIEGIRGIFFSNRSLNSKFNSRTVVQYKDGGRSIISGGSIVFDNDDFFSLKFMDDNMKYIRVNSYDIIIEAPIKASETSKSDSTKKNSEISDKNTITTLFTGWGIGVISTLVFGRIIKGLIG